MDKWILNGFIDISIYGYLMDIKFWMNMDMAWI